MSQHNPSKTVVTVEPSEAPIDRQTVQDALISIVQITDRVDLYCVSTATNAILPSADTKASSEIYALCAEGLSNPALKDKLTGAYPESYVIQTEPIYGLTSETNNKDGDGSTLAATEFKCVGTNWSEDTLLPLAPAFETGETAGLRVKQRSPLADAFGVLARTDCTGVYHVSIRPTDLSSGDLAAIKDAYADGIRPAREIIRAGFRSLGESADTDTTRSPTPRSGSRHSASSTPAKKMACITQGRIVEVDPRFILYGADATKQARNLANAFNELAISACNIEGKPCMGRRARQSYARAFDQSGGLRSTLRSKLRSPQYRLPVVKRLTRNQSTRFYVSEYALPHFISMEAPTEGETGGPRIDRRPPTAPPTPPNHVTHPSSDE